MDESVVRQIVAQYLMPGTDVETVDIHVRGDGGVEVSAGGRSWLITRYTDDEHISGDDMFEVLEARQPAPAGAVVYRRGFARFRDREAVELGQADGLARFWERVRAQKSPELLAAVIARYVRSDRVEGIQNLIVTRGDVRRHLSDAELDRVEGFTEFQTRQGLDNSMTLDFCTYWVGSPGPGSVWRVGLNRWMVEVDDASHTIRWSVRPLASNLTSAAY